MPSKKTHATATKTLAISKTYTQAEGNTDAVDEPGTSVLSEKRAPACFKCGSATLQL